MSEIKTPISVCIIAKNEEENIKPFFDSFKDILTHPDDEVVLVDTGSTDKTVKIAKQYGWKVIDRSDLCSKQLAVDAKNKLGKVFEEYGGHAHFKDGILTSFATARQAGFDAAKNDVCFWIDFDDDLVNGHLLRGIVDHITEQSAKQHRNFALFLRYDYSFADDGQCNTILWRERVVSKNGFKWKGGCHETLIPLTPDYLMARDVKCPVVIRHRAPKQHQFSDLRNYIILKNDILNKNDPRTMFYIANACRGLKLFTEAIKWYKEFIPQSGNKDDILSAQINLAYCVAQQGDRWAAIKVCLDALMTSTDNPVIYYTLAAIWGELGHWKNVVNCVKLGDQFQLQDTLHAVDPASIGYQPALALTQAYRNLKQPELALQAADRLIRCKQDDFNVKLVNDLRRWAYAEINSNRLLATLHQADNPAEAIKHFKLSPHLMDRGIVHKETKSPGHSSSKKTIAFFCGQSATTWGPPGGEKGVGASEKMVYEAAKRLVKKGFNVQVYCRLNRPEGVCKEGINWCYSGRFNPKLYRDIVVIWRMPDMVQKMDIECSQLYVWMHDVGNNGVWTTPMLSKLDKVWFLSDYHRSLHPAVPDDKVYITRNGVDLDKHLFTSGHKKKKIVYFSSPDRGWVTAIKAFNKSKLYKKGYEFHMFYGFGELWKQLASEQEYGHIVELNRDMRFYAYESECRQLAIQSKGVVYRGAVGWGEMAKELRTAKIWLYPTQFQEISCVAAMEAMAAGCKIVATDFAALKETLKDYPGWHKTTGADASNILLSAARDNTDPLKLAKFAKKFNMDTLINSWDADLFRGNDGDDNLRPSDNCGAAEDREERFGF